MMINDDGQGMIKPIMEKGNILYCQQSNGEYTICQKGFGIIETLGYDEPTEDFKQELIKMGFREVN